MAEIVAPRNHPTLADVARRAAVSTATVSRFLNGTDRVAEATGDRIAVAIKELGYQPNSLGRGLATQSTRTIGFVLPDITNPFFPELVKGVQDVAHERGYAVLLGNTDRAKEREIEYLSLLRRRQIDGAALVGHTLGRAELLALIDPGAPVVFLDRAANLPGSAVVQIDNRAAARAMTARLIELGHERIAHIAGPRGLSVARDRRKGYEEALTAAGIAPDRNLVHGDDFTEEVGYAAMTAILADAPEVTAVFAASDFAAIGAMAALRAAGRRIPEDVAVAGFDDIHLASYIAPTLTSVRQPKYEMGRRAAELLIDRIQGVPVPRGGNRVIYDVSIVERGSTGATPAERAPC